MTYPDEQTDPPGDEVEDIIVSWLEGIEAKVKTIPRLSYLVMVYAWAFFLYIGGEDDPWP